MDGSMNEKQQTGLEASTKDVDEERRLREVLQSRRARRRPSKDPDIGEDGSANNESDTKKNTTTNSHQSTSTNTQNPPSHLRSSSQSSGSVSRLAPGADTKTTQQRARGRRRRRERRRMNREARRARGESSTDPSERGYYSRSNYPYDIPRYGGGPDGPGRWERGATMPYRGGWGAQEFNPQEYYRGPPPSRYEYEGYGRRRRSRSRDRSESYSGGRSRGYRIRRSRSRSSSSRSRSSRDSSLPEMRRDIRYSRRERLDQDDTVDRESDIRRSRIDRSVNDRYRYGRRRPSLSESDSDSSSSLSSDDEEEKREGTAQTTFSKDQQTVFVTQLVMRAKEKDIRRYFRRKVGCKVNDVILLKDKRTGRHKGSAYVQVARIEDVSKAVGVSGRAPDFQRFPILVKASEAEKNYVIPASSSTVTASMMGNTERSAPMLSEDGKVVESQKVYVGSLDPSVTEEHIYALFSQFGVLEKVSMQIDPVTRLTRGYCFVSFRDPKQANLAIQTMSNQVLAGRPMKTGWANQSSSVPGVEVVTSEEFPPDASVRVQKAYTILAQLSGAAASSSRASASVDSSISTTAESAVDAAMGLTKASTTSVAPTVTDARTIASTDSKPDSKSDLDSKPDSKPAATDSKPAATDSKPAATDSKPAATDSKPAATDSKPAATTEVTEDTAAMVGGACEPTKTLLVHNMYDKNEEMETGWVAEIRQDFEEECEQFGKLIGIKVMSQQDGGKLFARFETVQASTACALNLAGRWFDKRRLRVEYVKEEDVPPLSPI